MARREQGYSLYLIITAGYFFLLICKCKQEGGLLSID